MSLQRYLQDGRDGFWCLRGKVKVRQEQNPYLIVSTYFEVKVDALYNSLAMSRAYDVLEVKGEIHCKPSQLSIGTCLWSRIALLV